MPQVEINWLAIVVTGFINMVIGSMWYSPLLFGNQWMAMMGIKKPDHMTPEIKKQMMSSYALNFIATLVMLYVLAWFVGATVLEKTVTGGLVAAFWLWLGFIVTVALGSVIWERKPIKLFLINTSYHLVTMLIAGAVFVVWRV